MTVLVTGGAGYIGSHLVWDLVDSGESVVVVDDLSTGFAWAVAPQVELFVADVGDQAAMTKIMRENGISSVVHFAGSVVVPESVRDPLGYYHNNTVKSRALIAAAVDSGVENFIFSSTAAVYGTPKAQPVTEDAPLTPESPYGWSKLMTEVMLRDVSAASDLRVCALRYFNVAGADPAGRTGQSSAGATHLIKVACEAALGKRDAISIYGTDYPTTDGTCVRDYVHVTDLAQAHVLALLHLRDGARSMIANVGYGRGYSVREVLAMVEHVTGRPLPVRETGRRAGDAVEIVADPRSAIETLGWHARYGDLELIVGDALRWEEHLSVAMAGRQPRGQQTMVASA